MSITLLGKHHPIRKHLNRLVKDSKYRRESDTCVLIGDKVSDEFIDRFPDQVQAVIVSENWQGDIPSCFNQTSIYGLPKEDYQDLVPMKSRPDWVLWVKKPVWDPKLYLDVKRIVIFDGVQNPENLGACIRSAVAFDWDLVLLRHCVDPYHPKSLRSMSGAISYCPIFDYESFASLLDDFSILSLDPEATLSLKKVINDDSIQEKRAVVFGSEGQGCSEHWKQFPHYQSIRIDINPKIESLNVSVAASLVMAFFDD